MRLINVRRLFWTVLAVVAAVMAGVHVAHAQLTRGFVTKIVPDATGEELNAHADLWVFEVDFKPMRMVTIELTDPKTRKKKRELIWYLVYRAVNRDLERPEDKSDTAPVNDDDPAPKSLFVPEFTLVGNDNDAQKYYDDVLIPQAQAAIIRRERLLLKNSVEVVGEIPDPVLKGAKDDKAIYGVVMWRGVDPETDFFTIFITGFSNAYRIEKGPDGQPLISRRTIVQEYWRPGDSYLQNEKEFRPKGDPLWIYRPDPLKDAAVPAGDSPPAKKPSAKKPSAKKPSAKK